MEARLSADLSSRYVLVHKLGAGSYGEVHLAQDRKQQGRRVAIKLLRDTADSPESYERFMQEAHALAQLSGSQHTVHLYDCGIFDNRPAMVLEYVAGETLEQFLDVHVRKGQQVDWRLALRLLSELAEALAVAHVAPSGAIIHRDVKPNNIMLVRSAVGSVHVKLLDFGVARLGGGRWTVQGEKLGTFLYMPPEQESGHLDQLSPASDVFAFGVVGLELLTLSAQAPGRAPWVSLGSDPQKFLCTLQQIRKDVPTALWELLIRAVAFDPGARYRDGQHLYDALRSLLAAVSAEDEAPPARHLRGRNVRIVALGLGLLCGVLIVAAVLRGGSALWPDVSVPNPSDAVLLSSWLDYPQQKEFHQRLCRAMQRHSRTTRCAWVLAPAEGSSMAALAQSSNAALVVIIRPDGSLSVRLQPELLFSIGLVRSTPAWFEPATAEPVTTYLAVTLHGLARVVKDRLGDLEWPSTAVLPVLGLDVIGEEASALGALVRYMRYGRSPIELSGLHDQELSALRENAGRCLALEGTSPWYCSLVAYVFVARCPSCQDGRSLLARARDANQAGSPLWRLFTREEARAQCPDDPLRAARLLAELAPHLQGPCEHLAQVGIATCVELTAEQRALSLEATPKVREWAQVEPKQRKECRPSQVGIALSQRGYWLSRTRHFKEASKALQQSYGIYPDHGVLINWAEALLHLGRRAQLRKLLDEQQQLRLLPDRYRITAEFLYWLAADEPVERLAAAKRIMTLVAAMQPREIPMISLGETLRERLCPSQKRELSRACRIYTALTSPKTDQTARDLSALETETREAI
jgi:serine/threonine protein kinase